ncbi:hypothetical protein [Haliangium ochraceum]|uniref:hypothetical protein n=1 Tax=Haliangium ochraceum TaxID=80816 RepID=UPI00019B97AC|nr:hypothetical protein [Haliangium ochraceum]
MRPGLAAALRSPALLALVVATASAGALSGCGEDPLQGPPADVAPPGNNIDLPEVPAFDVPGAHPDGTHSVREMRLQSAKHLNTEVQIKGFVVWIYDCVAELQGPDDDVNEIRKMVQEDPTKCQRPHFFLGDTPDTSGERSIWVVEVPRRLREDERRLLSRQERANLPDVPEVAVGDEVIVTGTWNRESPAGFANSDGLLVYSALENLSAE